MTIDELIRRLEAATGPDRSLDADIVMTAVYPATRDMPRSEYGGWIHPTLGLIAPASEYTDSIDAALTLYLRTPDHVPSDPRKSCVEALKQRLSNAS